MIIEFQWSFLILNNTNKIVEIRTRHLADLANSQFFKKIQSMSFLLRSVVLRSTTQTLARNSHLPAQHTPVRQTVQVFSTCLCRQNAHVSSKRLHKLFKNFAPRRGQNSLAPKDSNKNVDVNLTFCSLIKPLGFTVLVCAGSFSTAAIVQYENLRSRVQTARDSGHGASSNDSIGKAGKLRQKMNNLWNRLPPGEKVGSIIIAINVAVGICWRIPLLRSTMSRLFVSSPANKAQCWPMLLSTFSHVSLIHLFVNMYVLWTFCPVAVETLGPEQFGAFYVSAGVISSFTSYLYKVARNSLVPSVGASGAILGLLGLVCSQYPDSRLSIVLVDQIYPHSFSAERAMWGLIGFDTLGCLLNLGFFDHAAHLGGVLFGVWYHKYGNHLIWKKREVFVKKYHEFRGNV